MNAKKRTQLTSDIVESLLKKKGKEETKPTSASLDNLVITQNTEDTVELSSKVVEPAHTNAKTNESISIEGNTIRKEVSSLSHSEEIPDQPQLLDYQPAIKTHQSEVSLLHSENLRIAQLRITELEQETDRLRRDNEALTAAGETLKRKINELSSRSEEVERKLKNTKDFFSAEKEVLQSALSSKENELNQYKEKIESLEIRLNTDLKKIRVRERDLENRLEIAKMEGVALVRSKDEIILDLKRQIDQLNNEAENYRNKCQELYRQIESSREQFGRTVRALRIALAGLEGYETNANVKKGE